MTDLFPVPSSLTRYVEMAVDIGWREILADLKQGTIPATVATFSDLHDYVDANEYGGICDMDWDYLFDGDMKVMIGFGNRVQAALDAKIKASPLFA